MDKIFDITTKNRKLLYTILDDTPKEQLLEIPKGFRNNIWWNIAHVVVTQQLLVYHFSGLKVRVPEQFIENFKNGTVPDGTATDSEMKEIGDFLISTAEWAKQDYKSGLFVDYNEYTASINVTLKNVEDAITFNIFHEGLHLGAILGLQKMVKK